MAKSKPRLPLILPLATFIFAAYAIRESRSQAALPYHENRVSERELLIQGNKIDKEATTMTRKSARRLMIGSTAPTCTYNECRGCRYKCRAEQVPVEGNDPMNSAYHYRCVCHR